MINHGNLCKLTSLVRRTKILKYLFWEFQAKPKLCVPAEKPAVEEPPPPPPKQAVQGN